MAASCLGRGEPARRFEHLLGLTLAIYNHGLRSWMSRGDPDEGEKIFKIMGEEWKKLYNEDEGRLAARGISAELRKFALDACAALAQFLKDEGDEDSGRLYKFSFKAKPLPAKRAAPGSAQPPDPKRAKVGCAVPPMPPALLKKRVQFELQVRR